MFTPRMKTDKNTTIEIRLVSPSGQQHSKFM